MYQIIKSLGDGDGVTLKKGSPITYKSGWQVADFGVECTTVKECMKAIKKYDGTCGVWLENGIYYVDHSFRVNTKKEAMEIGKKYNQISIWGWKSQRLAYC